MPDYDEATVHKCAQTIVTNHVKAAMQSHAAAGAPQVYPTKEMLNSMYHIARQGVIAELKRRQASGVSDPAATMRVVTTTTTVNKPNGTAVNTPRVSHENAGPIDNQEPAKHTSAVSVIEETTPEAEVKHVAKHMTHLTVNGVDDDLYLDSDESEEEEGVEYLDAPEDCEHPKASHIVPIINLAECVRAQHVADDDDDSVESADDPCTSNEDEDSAQGDALADDVCRDLEDGAVEVIDVTTRGDTEEHAVATANVRSINPQYDRQFDTKTDIGQNLLDQDDMLMNSDCKAVVLVTEVSYQHSMALTGLPYEKPVSDVTFVHEPRRDNYLVMSDPAFHSPVIRAYKFLRNSADVVVLFGDDRLRTMVQHVRQYARAVWWKGRVVGMALLVADGAVFPLRSALKLELHPTGIDIHGHTVKRLVHSERLVAKLYPRMTDGFDYVRRRVPISDHVLVMIPCGRLIVPVGPFYMYQAAIGWVIKAILPPNAAGSPVISITDAAVVAQISDDNDEDHVEDGVTRLLTSWETVKDESAGGYGYCAKCGYTVNLKGHAERCAVQVPVDPHHKEISRRRAWVGDTVYMRIVRYMILCSNLPIKQHAIKQSEICSARMQRTLYSMYNGDKWPVYGSNDHAYSTAFEATIVDDLTLVTFVLDWLGKELRVDSSVDPAMFMPSDVEIEVAGVLYHDTFEKQ